jgi:hypothetical protein
MAQTGFTPISNYYSATATNVPTAGNLVAGELAINTADGKLFYKDSSGVVQTLATKATTAGTYSSITTNNLTIGTTQLGVGDASIMKNRIINGAMVIDQRNAGAVKSYAANSAAAYSLDRFYFENKTDGTFNLQQSSTAPAGFSNSLLVTVTSADASLGATQYSILSQNIEGFNTADLNWGSANAKTVTLSFWVQSSLTGTFGGAIENSAQNRSYPFTYTISAANTWEQKSVTIAGDTTGTWIGATNGIGLAVFWNFGTGSTYSGTAGSWAGTTYLSATGATSVVGTNGATFYITGVQLEVGSSATGFEYRLYNQELSACQRYFYNATPSNPYGFLTMGATTSTTGGSWQIPLPVPMRTTPTFAYSGAIVIKNLSSVAISSFAGPYGTASPCNSAEGDFTCAVTLSGAAAFINFNNSGKLATFNAEL